MDIKSVRDCNLELDRLSREQQQATRTGANWKHKHLNRLKRSVLQRRDELQHGDLFRVLGQELIL